MSFVVLTACSPGTSDATDTDTDTDTVGDTDTSDDTDEDTDDDTVDETDSTDETDDTELGPMLGTPVVLSNPSFESQNLSAGTDRYQGFIGQGGLLIPGWTYYIGDERSGVGVARPLAASFSTVEPLASPADGTHAGLLDGRNGGLEDETNAILIHTVDTTVMGGSVIHARMAFGTRLEDSLVKPHDTVKLEIVLNTTIVVAQTSVTMPAAGGWTEAEISYEVPSEITSFQVRAVGYQSNMDDSTYWQTYVDNLRVSIE